jgi:hypothetical protein
MGDVLSLIRGVGQIVSYGPLSWLFRFLYWFYIEVIPFIIQYIALPMFVLGMILALAFAGGTLLFTVIFFIFMYFFIKGTIFGSKPKIK